MISRELMAHGVKSLAEVLGFSLEQSKCEGRQPPLVFGRLILPQHEGIQCSPIMFLK